MAINRIALQGFITGIKEGVSKNGNPYLFFTLRHETQAQDGRIFTMYMDCQAWGDSVEKLKPYVKENVEKIVEGQLKSNTRTTEWGDVENKFVISVYLIKELTEQQKNTSVYGQQATQVSHQSAYTTSTPVEHKVEVKPRRSSQKEEVFDAEVIDDEPPF